MIFVQAALIVLGCYAVGFLIGLGLLAWMRR